MLDIVGGVSGVAEAFGFAAVQGAGGGLTARTKTTNAALHRATITLKRVTQEHEDDVLAAEETMKRAVDALNRARGAKGKAVTVAKMNLRQCESRSKAAAVAAGAVPVCSYDDRDLDIDSDYKDEGLPTTAKKAEARSAAATLTALELIQEQSTLFDLRNSSHNILFATNSDAENNSAIIKPALVDLLRQLNVDSSKQQKAFYRLARLMRVHQHLCATDDKVARTLNLASNGCAVAVISTEAIQQQSAKIRECLNTFDVAQRAKGCRWQQQQQVVHRCCSS